MGSLGLGVMPLSIQGVMEYQTMFSAAYLGCDCVHTCTTLCSIWIMYSPLYILSTFSWNIFNSDNVLGTYIYGFKSYSFWLSSNCFLIQKRFIIQNKSNAKSFATNIFSVAKKYECNNSSSLLQFYFVSIHLIAIKIDWCYSS